MAELVLVTGGSGYIAGWCIAELLSRGYEVRTTVRDPGREQGVVDAVSSVADPAGRLSFAVADLTADDGRRPRSRAPGSWTGRCARSPRRSAAV